MSEPRFRRTDEELWTFALSAVQLDGFVQPYIGNGNLGTRVGRLVAGTPDDAPLLTLSKTLYDNGQQLAWPEWNGLHLETAGEIFAFENGHHSLRHTLDLRNGMASLDDLWEVKPGVTVRVRIEMLVPRGFDRCSVIRLRLDDLPSAATLRFGLRGAHVADALALSFSQDGSFLLGEYSTRKQNRRACQGLCWQATGWTLEAATVAEDSALVTAKTTQNSAELLLFHAVANEPHESQPQKALRERLSSFVALGWEEICERNEREWRQIWPSALAFRHPDARREKMVLAHQFYLLCSLGDSRVVPFGCVGLSMNNWGGSQLWDADFWDLRAILALWPKMARPIIEFRFQTLDKARQHAEKHGFRGAWFPWGTDDEGNDATVPHYVNEIHLGIWVALAAFEYSIAAADDAFLREKAWPLCRDIADFYASRGSWEDDDRFHLRGVIGPDEAVTEFGAGSCDDNFLINFGVRRVMEIALQIAENVGEAAPLEWEKVRDGVFLLQPDEQGIIPEFAGYAGQGIKQADTILAFYPLGFAASDKTILQNIRFYREKIMAYGPLMSSQIEACLLMKMNRKEEGLNYLFGELEQHVRGPHLVPNEGKSNDCTVFLTGVGGELQALIYGFYGAQINDTSVLPRIGNDE